MTPLAGFVDPDAVTSVMATISADRGSLLILFASYLAAGLVAFPVTLLVIATAAAFGPWLGFLYSGVGLIASAALTYGVGKWLWPRDGAEGIRFAARFSEEPRRACGCGHPGGAGRPVRGRQPGCRGSGVRLPDDLAGTAIGIPPPLLALSVLGHQVFRTLTDPNPVQLALVAGAIALWIAAAIGVQRFITRSPHLS